ncbi:ABC-2 transporter permease [Coraliomargarita algicola]|uniref:ABC-2 transporter permease n=1 Tax=Coraliomargarita algicola TaxID=3092156 RepID=A0ABZ0RT43_9BACT|nr:ABC-2 transporter permease [Coraliomargarita sp. J2-16]WPJ97955.1 ABC-2 transporter permease [Coraliomargarita sp. J2-16]
MHTIFHLLKWQIREHRILLCVNSALLTVLLAIPLLTDSSALTEITLLLKVCLLVSCAVLCTRITHAQPYTGSESFWMTRPLSRRAHLASQLLLLSLFILLPTLAGMLAMTIHMDGEATHYLAALLSWGIYVGSFLFLFALTCTTSTASGAIILIIAIFTLAGILGSTATSNFSNGSRPNPDALVILMPTLGILALICITVFIKRITQTRIVLILLGVAILPLLSVIQSFKLGSTAEAHIANAPKIKLLTQPPQELNRSQSSYYHPLLLTSENPRRVTIPNRLSLETENGTFIRKYFRTNNTQLNPLFTDKIMAAFPAAVEVVSTTNIAPFLKVAGNEFIDIQNEVIDSFTLENERSATLCLTDYSIQQIGALPLTADASKSRSGLRFSIHAVKSSQHGTQVQYSLQRSITKDINNKQRWAEVYMALYDPQSKRLIVQLSKIAHYPLTEKSSLTTHHQSNTFNIPTDLLTPSTELHIFIIKKEKYYCMPTSLAPGVYYSSVESARKPPPRKL